METIAANVGYENVEHFNRLFKKAYDMTRYSIENRARNKVRRGTAPCTFVDVLRLLHVRLSPYKSKKKSTSS